MGDETNGLLVPDEMIMNQIYHIRGHKVMLDVDLAKLYEVETKHLKRQVYRNVERFPDDFMFELSIEEQKFLRSQFGTLRHGAHSKYSMMAFTAQGVAMLSSVLNGKRAISVNIQIIRIFTRIRQILVDNTDMRLEIEKIKNKLNNQDKNMEIVFRYLDELLEKQEKPNPPRKRICYKADEF
jgi:phage regulator Rha-like protein